MKLFSLHATWFTTVVTAIILFVCAVSPFFPAGLALAQTTPSPQAANGVSCSGLKVFSNLSTCIFGAATSFIASSVIWVTGIFLEIASNLLNYAIELTVGTGASNTGFEAQIYPRIKGGVESVWTAFRDIANIMIIGMFTFIALTMILGIEKFGAKKMVANVLVVAILINFSLLFTRIIISSSNFVATQFYKAVQLDVNTASGQAAATSGSSIGISGRLTQLMGVGTFGQTGEALFKNAQKSNSPLLPLLHGIMTAIIFIGAALLFFYASFLLIARAILFIFLLITSSLAFASHLIPGGGFGGYGWSAWWSALLKNAVFGPLLILFLWATLRIGEGIKATNSSLGGLLDESGSGISALFSYLMILGMLYLSIKVASSFSTKIGGFNLAATVPAFGAGFLARAGGAFGRNTIGRGLSAAARTAEKASKDESRGMQSRQFYDRAGQILQKGAKRDFNLLKGSVAGMNLGKEIQKSSGFKRVEDFAGKDVGGVIGADKARGERYAAQAERINPNQPKEETDTLLSKERGAALAENPTLQKEKADATLVRESATASLIALQKQQTEATNAFTEQLKDLESKFSSASSDASADPGHTGKQKSADDLKISIEHEKSQHKAFMSEQAKRIEEATKATARAGQAEKETHKRIDDILTKVVTDKLPKSTADVAAALANKRLTNLFGFGKAEKDDVLAQQARKSVGESGETKRLRRQLAILKEEDKKSTPQPLDPAPHVSTPPKSATQ